MSTIRCSVDLPREVVATLGGRSFQTPKAQLLTNNIFLNSNIYYIYIYMCVYFCYTQFLKMITIRKRMSTTL